MRTLLARLLVASTLAALALSAAAEEPMPLSLPEAVKMTLANNPMHKAAMADTKATSAGVRGAGDPMLPGITFAESFTGGNDPVFVFGTKLRQQEFTAADFALNQLNRPTPIGNYASRFFGSWNLFDSTQSWKALDRAKYMNFAAEQQLNRTDQELVYQTVQAYYGVLLSQKQGQVAGDADKSVAMARGAFGPRVNAFGSWEEDSHSVGWTGANNWVAGAEVQFDLFAGGSKRAALAREKAMQERASAGYAGFQDSVRLEVRQAYYQFDAAQQQVKVARGAIAQADESLRINQNRYEGGLSTVTDMLRVEEAAHRAKADYWQAVYRMNASYAGVELATGTLTLDSPAVTQ